MAKEEFFEKFRALHAMDAKAPLNKGERAEYDLVKERFAEAICAAQKRPAKPGRTARETFRVAMLFRLKLTVGETAVPTSTLDVSRSGFSAALTTTPALGTVVSFELIVTKSDVISGTARVEDTMGRGRAFFAFVEPPQRTAAEALERLMFDELIRQLAGAAAAARPG